MGSGWWTRSVVGLALATGLGLLTTHCHKKSNATAVAHYLYVANLDGPSVSGFSVDAGTGALTEVPQSPFPVGTGATRVRLRGTNLYVTNHGGNTVSGFYIDPATGNLAEMAQSPYASGTGPSGLDISPDGKLVFAAEETASDILPFTIDSVGELHKGTPLVTGAGPRGLVVHPSAAFLYVANRVAGTVSGYAYNATTGALTALAGSPYPAAAAEQVVIDSGGRFLFASLGTGNAVAAFTINAGTGVLTPVAGSPFSAGGTLAGFPGLCPGGTSLYVPLNGSGNLAVFSIAATGVLTPVSGSPFAVVPTPKAVLTDLQCKYLYVSADFSGVAAYTIGVGGAPQPIAGSPFPTDPTPGAMDMY